MAVGENQGVLVGRPMWVGWAGAWMILGTRQSYQPLRRTTLEGPRGKTLHLHTQSFSYRFIFRAEMLRGWLVFWFLMVGAFYFLERGLVKQEKEMFIMQSQFCVWSFRVGFMTPFDKTNRVFNARFKNRVSLGMFQTGQQWEVHAPRLARGPHAARVEVPPSPAGTSLTAPAHSFRQQNVHEASTVCPMRPSGARSPCSSQ